MADFTEEILKREIKNGEQMVEQLTGIKEALSNSGSGGGNSDVMFLHPTVGSDMITLDRTTEDIMTAWMAGKRILWMYEAPEMGTAYIREEMVTITSDGTNFSLKMADYETGREHVFFSNSVNDYPACERDK